MVAEKFNIVAVVTAPDRPAGRGRQIKKSAVKEFSEEHNLRIIQPTNLKDPGFCKTIKRIVPRFNGCGGLSYVAQSHLGYPSQRYF